MNRLMLLRQIRDGELAEIVYNKTEDLKDALKSGETVCPLFPHPLTGYRTYLTRGGMMRISDSKAAQIVVAVPFREGEKI